MMNTQAPWSGRRRWRARPGWLLAWAVIAIQSILVIEGAASAAAGPELSLRPYKPSRRAAPARALDPARFRDRMRIEGAAADTARLMVILVEFPEETPDDPQTTGRGRFELVPSNRYPTNRPPHDHEYFRRQCQSLANYFAASTGDRLTLEWDIYPPASPRAEVGSPLGYEMPMRMRYYNPDTTQVALDRRLAEFFRDAIVAADAGGGGALPFAAYDYYVIFHAGVGLDLILDDDTPSDIPSAFLSAEELAEFLGETPEWPGISVQGGTHHVREGLWLPETENQEGFEFALTGVFAQLMGSQLGLPILWNPDSGAPGIGRFGLMDQGGGNESGMIPAFPCAWSRLDRGWADAVVVADSMGALVKSLGALGAGAELIVVPVDDREYFLIENRKKDIDENGEFAVVIEAGDVSQVPIGVVSNEYDAGIPGSGLLIWHIDQAVIDETRDQNRVNADFRHRGVKLLEADGLDDIGLRPEGGFGLPEDTFFAGNNDRLTPTSNPSSLSNYGDASTHVFITAISDTGLVMSCTIANDIVLPGWPDSSGIAYAAVPPAAGDVDDDGEIELVVVDDDSTVIVLGPTAEREALLAGGTGSGAVTTVAVADVIPAVDPPGPSPDPAGEEIIVARSGGTVTIYDGRLQAFDTETLLLNGPGSVPAVIVTDADGDAAREIVAGGAMITIWNDPTDPPIEIDPPFAGGVRFLGGAGGEIASIRVLAIDAAGRLVGYRAVPTVGSQHEYELALDAATGRAPSKAPVIGDLDRDGVAEIVILSGDRRLTAYAVDGAEGPAMATMRALEGWPIVLESVDSAPALGDLDGDGRPDVVIGDEGKLRAYGFNGVRLEGWPVALVPFGDPGRSRVQPLIADVDGDGRQDAVLASPDGLLRAYHGDGRLVAGWPVPAGRDHVVTPIVSALSGGALSVVSAGTPWLYGFSIAGAAAEAHWPAPGGPLGQSGLLPRDRLGPVASADEFFPASAFYVYPNPAHEAARFRYFLGEPATVEVLLFDTSGLEVVRLTGEGVGGVMNEIVWDLRNDDGKIVTPGLYVARVVARGPAGTASHETKLAVSR